MKSYKSYHKDTIDALSQIVRNDGAEIAAGQWMRGKSNLEYLHILPLKGRNTLQNRLDAIHQYLGVSIDVENDFPPQKRAIHTCIHHLNSSQLLCYMVFRPLMTNDHMPTSSLVRLLEDLGITISSNARCDFEFNDNWVWDQNGKPEGTSFDFHISDDEYKYFFEIKFTENGFGKAKNDDEHKKKINDIYLDKIKKVVNTEVSERDCCEYYQLFRNIIRGDSKSKTIVFITDKNNTATESCIESFREKFLVNSSARVLFLKWQDMCKYWPQEIQKPFQFVCFEHN